MNVARNSGLLMLIAGCVSACTVGPDYLRPAALPGSDTAFVALNPSVDGSADPADNWWSLYQDEQLDRYLAEALAANFDMKAAEANLSAARALVYLARSGRYPQTQVEAGGKYGRDATTDEILKLQGHAPVTTWLLRDVVEAAYEIDLWGRVRRTIEASQADAGAVDATRDSVRVVVAAETTRAYARICTLGEQLAVAQRSLEIVTRQAEIVSRRREAGATSNFDVVRANGLVAQVRATLPPLDGQRRAALFELTALLGRSPSSAPLEATACVTPPRLASRIPAGNGASLIRRRPDVRRAERLLAAATARIGVATAELYPKVSLVGLYGGVGTRGADLTSADGRTWAIGPSIGWSFPNQSAPRARISSAKANAAAALANFDSAVQTALKEVEQALVKYGSELDRQDSLSAAQRDATEAFTLANDQSAAGSLSVFELLSAERELVSANAALSASDAQVVQDQIAVFKALGGGWVAQAPRHP